MANMRLRETILAVVDNQLRDNDPPCTRRAYERLQKAGYSRKEPVDLRSVSNHFI